MDIDAEALRSLAGASSGEDEDRGQELTGRSRRLFRGISRNASTSSTQRSLCRPVSFALFIALACCMAALALHSSGQDASSSQDSKAESQLIELEDATTSKPTTATTTTTTTTTTATTMPTTTTAVTVPLAPSTSTSRPATRDATTFYMYRAQSSADYAFENVNAANLPGVMWYLEHEVVFSTCPRHYNITRILRYLVTIKTPPTFAHNFSRFFAFDKGMCTTPVCGDEYQKNGFNVGCQYQAASAYRGAVWYSLPGRCPLTPLEGKNHACEAAMPGGRCERPSGSKDCTWSAIFAGAIDLAELEGVEDWERFCEHHGNEYILPFWDGRGDQSKMNQRLEKVLAMFEAKFPQFPLAMEAPLCDWRPSDAVI